MRYATEDMLEQICELRFKPIGKVLDMRGEIAEALSTALDLPRWELKTSSTCHLFDESRDRIAFVSHRNLGVHVSDAVTPNDFVNLAAKLAHSFSQTVHRDQVQTVRLGVRTRIFEEREESFSEIRTLFEDCFLTTCAKSFVAESGDPRDIGITWDLGNEIAGGQIQCGPVVGKEMEPKHYFELSEVAKNSQEQAGLYANIDSFQTRITDLGRRPIHDSILRLMRPNLRVMPHLISSLGLGQAGDSVESL